MSTIIPAPRIDWNMVLLALRTEGYSLNDVATFTSIPRSTLTSWMSGCSPNHQDGETLIKFWGEAMQRPRESLPVVDGIGTGARLYANRE